MSWAEDTWASSVWGAPTASIPDPTYESILVIEDGTGVTNANAYASLTFMDNYHSNLGNTNWSGGFLVRENAALRFMRWLDGQEHLLQGERTYDNQCLAWPRCGVFIGDKELDNDVVPLNVLKAYSEGTLIEFLKKDATAPTLKDGGGKIKESFKKLGPMSKGVTYGAATSQEKSYQSVMLYLEPYFESQSFRKFKRG